MLVALIIGVLALALSAALLAKSNPTPADAEGLRWVQWGLGSRAAALCGVIAMALIVIDGVEEGRLGISILFAGSFGLLVIPVAANGFFWRVGFGVRGLRCCSPWRKERNVLWTEILRVSFSSGMRQWIIHTEQQGLIRINELTNGSDELIAQLQLRGVSIGERSTHTID